MQVTSDPKPVKRIKDSRLVTQFALRMGSCAVCGRGRQADLQAHHVLYRSRGGDDVVANLVALCLEDHAAVHDGHRPTRHLLGQHIAILREDVLEYLSEKMGPVQAREYLVREYGE